MSSTSDKTMEAVIQKVTARIENVNLSRLELAKELLHAKNVIVWKHTDYRSWLGFCRVHVKLSMPAVYRYILAANLIIKFKYTDKECVTIIKAIGWHNFMLGIVRLTRKISVTAFIAKYEAWQAKPRKPSWNPDADRAYTYSLPAEQANKIDGYLIEYGMTTNPETGRRQGVRAAMMALIDNQLA